MERIRKAWEGLARFGGRKQIRVKQHTHSHFHLVSHHTGGGKTLVLLMTANAVAGITLIIVPLLALTANLLSRVKQVAKNHVHMVTHHMDELSKSNFERVVLPQINGIDCQSSTTLILLCSPQALANNTKFREAMLACNKKSTLDGFPLQVV